MERISGVTRVGRQGPENLDGEPAGLGPGERMLVRTEPLGATAEAVHELLDLLVEGRL
jgi:hypothetical protein